jgi:PIN domain nuclease of toxin-antitoxin system
MSSSTITIESAYVVDTHALIWYLTGHKKLSKQAAQIFAAAERGETRLIVSAIVIAELYYANQKNKWFPDFSTLYGLIKTKPYYRFLAFRADKVQDFDYDISIPEMHDRIVAGLARRLNVPLLTSDPLIIDAKVVRTIW